MKFKTPILRLIIAVLLILQLIDTYFLQSSDNNQNPLGLAVIGFILLISYILFNLVEALRAFSNLGPLEARFLRLYAVVFAIFKMLGALFLASIYGQNPEMIMVDLAYIILLTCITIVIVYLAYVDTRILINRPVE